MQNTLSELRRKLIFRSWHRGTREMDLLLGHFADARLGDFNENDLRLYEELLKTSDPDLYGWITASIPLPENELRPIVDMLVEFFRAES